MKSSFRGRLHRAYCKLTNTKNVERSLGLHIAQGKAHLNVLGLEVGAVDTLGA